MATTGPQDKQLWLLGREGQGRVEPVAEIALRLRNHTLYSYSVPEPLADGLAPGALVEVPYGAGRRLVEGWCVRISRQPWSNTRAPIARVLRPSLGVPDALVELALWVGEYYACPPGAAFDALDVAARRAATTRTTRIVQLAQPEAPASLTARQRALFNALRQGPLPVRQALEASGVGIGVLRKLVRTGVLALEVRREPIAAAGPADEGAPATSLAPAPTRSPEDQFVLTPDQQNALAAILSACEAGGFATCLLFGVPGSGKTEVYVRAIRAVLARGRQALLVVPEIALATQVVERLSRRFSRVAVLHSRLTPAQRRLAWCTIAGGGADVVIGTRSAVFAPLARLGLIVIDEEQEASLKNLAVPYYQARDVAIKRGQIERVPVVLGSATPALETWHNATRAGRFKLLRLPQRIPGASQPLVQLVATDRRALGQTTAALAPALLEKLRETLARGQQAILLHNRRGYATDLRCIRCGLAATCVACGRHLVLHRSENCMKCHLCGRRSDIPPTCLDSTCNGPMQRSGLAIQKLEEELRQNLPAARLLRLDSDTMRKRDDYAAALARFERGEADVLLGTQMVAKGLDFPAVALVGVLDADAALRLPDFRAAERTFQLLVQVVGRAGRRDGESLALIQSADPGQSVLSDALRGDYEAFAARELETRRRLFYPPWARLVRLVFSDARASLARRAAQQVAEALGEVAGRLDARIQVSQAEPCAISRLRGRARYEVLIRAPRGPSLQSLLRDAASAKRLRPRVERFTIDVDPLDMM